ncbi:hypothetical protein CTI12_AA104180 [Artemisia annua]|uniref:Uncharacterized protein n=1 Tax=Artemisia annua TaxID=35608 RepID=A0A2U1NGD5_ARTAN|nr:hypothetical protein CTI12_AA104180 [Artemisia annua]
MKHSGHKARDDQYELLREVFEDISSTSKFFQDSRSFCRQIDPSILGGLVVEFGQKVFDMSIKTRAKHMERFLRDPINFDS